MKRAVFTVVLLLAPACRRQVPPPPLPPTPIAAVWAIGDGDTLERDARDHARHLAGCGMAAR